MYRLKVRDSAQSDMVETKSTEEGLEGGREIFNGPLLYSARAHGFVGLDLCTVAFAVRNLRLEWAFDSG